MNRKVDEVLGFVLIIGIAVFAGLIPYTMYKGLESSFTVEAGREITLVLPADVDEVISGTNGTTGVSICYKSTDGTEKIIQYNGADYKRIHVFQLTRGK